MRETTSGSLPDLELLDRYYAGELDTAELAQIRTYLSDPRVARQVAVLGSVWVKEQQGVNVDAAWGNVRPTAGVAYPSTAPLRSSSSQRPFSPRISLSRMWQPRMLLGSIAGIVLAVVAANQLWRARSPGARELHALYIVETLRGQQKRVELPDGSMVRLAGATRIRYSPKFGATDRTVELDGQALFTVTHAEGDPFVFHAGGTTARVLGTSFAIRRYASDSATRITVAEGKIALAPQRSAPTAFPPVVLTSGDVAHATQGGTITKDTIWSVGDALAWAQGKLVFRNTRLSDVVADIGRTYGVDVLLATPALHDHLMTGTVGQPSAAEALTMIATTFRLRVERRGPSIFLLREQ